MEEVPKVTTTEEDEIVNKVIKKYENELNKLKSFKFIYTGVDTSSRIIVFILLFVWILITLMLNIQKTIVGTIIIWVGIFYSLLSLFRPLVVTKINSNFGFLLIGFPLYIWLDKRYSGDVEYIARIFFSLGIFAVASIIEYPMEYEKSGLIRNLTTVYTVLMILYILYDLSINIK